MNIKKVLSPFLNPYTGPIFVITLILIFILANILPNYSVENKNKQMTDKAVSIINNLKSIRSYYTQNVIKEVKKHSSIKINYDHKDKIKTIPLPATLVHDLSEIMPEKDMKIKMFSNYPFPNRKNRVLNEFEKDSLAWLINNPNKIYTKTLVNNNEKRFTVTLADTFYDPSCVKCHNSRADTPKNDWKIGDVRGVIQISMPYPKEFILSGEQTILILSIFVLLILILTIHYTVVSFKRQKDNNKIQQDLEKKVEERTLSLESSNVLLNQYKKAVDASAIFSKTNNKGIITYVNDEFIRTSQYSEEELVGNNHSIIRHPDMPDSIFEDLWKTIKDKKIWKGQIKNRAKDGSSYYVASTIVPILNYDNEIEEFLAIRLDITKVIRAQKEAQKADEAKSTFLANMSHEIRTPLNAIIGFSDILCRSKGMDAKSMKQSQIIQTSANSLLSIINDILDVSKIESGNFDIGIEETDIYLVSEHVVELFSKRAIEKNIRLIFNLDYKIPMCLLTDGVRIRQVLSNLISNAIKFTPEHGIVEINISMLEIQNNKASIRFEIKDTGIGIPKEKIDKVFQPFIQVDHKSNREYQGTGLGLSICTHIIELFNSKIHIESEIGKGTNFWFDIDFEICDDHTHTNKDYIEQVNFQVSDVQSDLYHYIKRYLNIFGTINMSSENTNDILIHSCIHKSNEKLQMLREQHKDEAILILFEYEEDIDKFTFKDNEQALALPFYASKVNDALQELQKKTKKTCDIRTNDEESSYTGKVLIAEDNMANQELISYILDSMNVNYKIESNGQEALNEYIKNKYDLVLMDINMPVLDGIGAFNSIREYEEKNYLSSTPIIALTANAIKGDKEKFLSLGMDGYLSKPINSNELKIMFDKYLIIDNINIEEEQIEEKKTITENNDIDLEKIATRIGVSTNIAKLIVNKFKKEILSDLTELKTYVEEKENTKINEKAHYIKNSCLNVALDDICDLLQKLESQENILEYKTLYDELETKINLIVGE
ncbi:ATP-binding protein [Poseidonibacter lekithochrous]|uniref:ATP-binding protein n=1 Tax=Poseidonibacter lekithochrous TaxID=1904463 RepID=UPI000D37B699|nr:ATP-binding protein [Poseidonibacter lekithochrous]